MAVELTSPTRQRGLTRPALARVSDSSPRGAPRVPLLGADEHLPGVAAVEGPDDPILGHVVDEARRLAVTDSQGALKQRRAATLLADDDLDRLLVERVALAEFLAGRPAAGLRL